MASHELTTEHYRSDDAAFEGLQHEWDELLLASDSNCLFLTWEWLYTWWIHLADDRSLFILAVRRGSELVALAPLGLLPRACYKAGRFRTLSFWEADL